MSAESGISTFRDSDGLWEKYRVEDVATPEGFAANPKLVLDFYNQRRRELLNTKPNAGHLGLAVDEGMLRKGSGHDLQSIAGEPGYSSGRQGPSRKSATSFRCMVWRGGTHDRAFHQAGGRL